MKCTKEIIEKKADMSHINRIEKELENVPTKRQQLTILDKFNDYVLTTDFTSFMVKIEKHLNVLQTELSTTVQQEELYETKRDI